MKKLSRKYAFEVCITVLLVFLVFFSKEIKAYAKDYLLEQWDSMRESH